MSVKNPNPNYIGRYNISSGTVTIMWVINVVARVVLGTEHEKVLA